MNRMLQQKWDEYRTFVIHPLAGPVQIRDTKTAFYAGAAVVFSGLVELVSKSRTEEEPTEAELQALTDLAQELTEFEESLK